MVTFVLAFTLGIIFAILFTGKAIKVEIKHITENISAPITDADIAAMEKDIDKDDPTTDKIYKEMGEVISDVADIMKGSDRV